MSAKIVKEKQENGLDTIKWVFVVLLVVAGVAGNIYFDDQSLLYRVLAMVAVAIVALLVALQTAQGDALWQLAKGSRAEIRKVVWPTRPEATQTTLIVVAFVVVMGLILWGLDSLIGKLVSLILG